MKTLSSTYQRRFDWNQKTARKKGTDAFKQKTIQVISRSFRHRRFYFISFFRLSLDLLLLRFFLRFSFSIFCFASAQSAMTMAHSRSFTILFVLSVDAFVCFGSRLGRTKEIRSEKQKKKNKSTERAVCSSRQSSASIGNTFCSRILFILWWPTLHLGENGEMQMLSINIGEVKRRRARKKNLISFWFVRNINNNTKIEAGKWCYWMLLANRFQCRRVRVGHSYYFFLLPLCWVDGECESGSNAIISVGMVFISASLHPMRCDGLDFVANINTSRINMKIYLSSMRNAL